MKVQDLRLEIMKDTYTKKSLFTEIEDAFNDKDYSKASNLYLVLESKMSVLRKLYSQYQKNLLDI